MRQGLLRSTATLGFVLLWMPLVAAQTPAEERQKPGTPEFQESHKRILHVVPTFSVVPPGAPFKPLTAEDKFVLGATHAFDRITIVKSVASAAISQADDAPPGYGQGWDAYGVRVGAAAASIGGNEFFSTFLFPVLLHQDPRYFGLQKGKPKQRVWYAVSQIWNTRTDSGGRTFNSAKILGTLFNAGLVNAYYPAEDRTVAGTFQRFGIRLAIGAGTNVLQEFVPEIRRLFSKKSKAESKIQRVAGDSPATESKRLKSGGALIGFQRILSCRRARNPQRTSPNLVAVMLPKCCPDVALEF